jgi:hypothetical protein
MRHTAHATVPHRACTQLAMIQDALATFSLEASPPPPAWRGEDGEQRQRQRHRVRSAWARQRARPGCTCPRRSASRVCAFRVGRSLCVRFKYACAASAGNGAMIAEGRQGGWRAAAGGYRQGKKADSNEMHVFCRHRRTRRASDLRPCFPLNLTVEGTGAGPGRQTRRHKTLGLVADCW